MSVHFVSGSPGGGKSLYAVKLIVAELTRGHRPVVTNLALRPGRLNEYLQTEFPDLAVNLVNRLRILEHDEARSFYLKRVGADGGGYDVAPVTDEEEEAGKRPDYSIVQERDDKGVLYVIDEIHEHFNARAWMETGRSALHYLSQHRKLGDDLICITQSIGNVDKQFRSVAQDYTTLTNLKKRKIGWFAMPGLFLRRTYCNPPTGPAIKPMEIGRFRLDVTGLASCYDTASGVGLHGRLADTQEKRSGLPWWVAAVGVVVLGGSAILLPGCMAKKALKGGGPLATMAGASRVLPAGTVVGSNVPKAFVPSVSFSTSPVETNYCRGFAYVNGDVRCLMADGRILSVRNGEVAKVTQNGIWAEGRFYRLK